MGIQGIHGNTGYIWYTWVYMGIQVIQGIHGIHGYTKYTWVYREINSLLLLHEQDITIIVYLSS